MGGGLYAALLVAVRSHGNQPNGSAADTQWVGGWPKAHGPLCLGKHQCISSPPSSLEYSPPRDGPPNTRGPLEVLVGIVLGELDSSTPRVSKTIEIYPDKNTRVGSLHKPREYDDRLPPDAGYYLDLVIPRKEESRKKNTCMFE